MTLLDYAIIAISIVLVALVLIQNRGDDAGTLFGGAGAGYYQQRRGIEKLLFNSTIAFIAVFVIVTVVNLIAK
ncbi:MAG TPA: preprotein translocase subunit SecG [Candidatus Tyrphobacter sp.]|nr:preprotein translocase subunit SecG [Candidatus Tyrphobacter sp.]